MNNRSSKRAGHGILIGSRNGQLFVQDTEPPASASKHKDVWIKTSATKAIYVYNSATPTWTLIVSA